MEIGRLEDKGRVQVLVVLFRVIPVKFSRFFAVYGEKVGPGIVGPQRFEEFLEGGMEAGSGVSDGMIVEIIQWLCAPLWIYLDNRWLLLLGLFALT
jgi:hypothetical protein